MVHFEEVYGKIDGFDLPNRLRGFAFARTAASFDDELIVVVQLGDIVVEKTIPRYQRIDVIPTGEPIGWSLSLPANSLGLPLLLTGDLNVFAVASNGQRAQLTLWDKVLPDLERRCASKLADELKDRIDDDMLVACFAEMEKGARVSSEAKNRLRRVQKLFSRNATSAIPKSSDTLSRIYLPVGTESLDGSAILGHEDHIFLVEGSNAVLSRYLDRGEHLHSLSEKWQALIRKRAEICYEHGATFLQMFVPEKMSVLPKLLPFEIEVPSFLLHLITEGLKNHDIYIDAIQALGTVGSDAFCKTDSHQSCLGSYTLFLEILKRCKLPLPDCAFSENRTQRISGDLGFRMLGVPPYEEISVPDKNTGTDPLLIKEVNPARGNTGTIRSWQNVDAPIKKRVLAFGNSCFERGSSPLRLSWWMSRHFSEFVFVWNENFDVPTLKALAPELVISQTVERFLYQRFPTS